MQCLSFLPLGLLHLHMLAAANAVPWAGTWQGNEISWCSWTSCPVAPKLLAIAKCLSLSWLSGFSWACYSGSFVVFCLQTVLLLKCSWGFEMTSPGKLRGSCLLELILCWKVRDSEGGQSSGLKRSSLSLFLKLLAFLKLGLWGPGNILLYRPHQWFMRAFVLDLFGSVAKSVAGRKLTVEQLESLPPDTSIHSFF